MTAGRKRGEKTMALIDFTAPLHNFDGSVINETGAPDSPAATLGSVCCNALMAQLPDEKPTGAQKAARFALAATIHNQQARDVKAEDVVLMKDLIGKLYGAGVCGAAWELLDPPAPATQPEQPEA